MSRCNLSIANEADIWVCHPYFAEQNSMETICKLRHGYMSGCLTHVGLYSACGHASSGRGRLKERLARAESVPSEGSVLDR